MNAEVAKSKVENAIETAIYVGYRHIDSSHVYLNEEEIGRAIQKKAGDGTVKRDDIFFTLKLWLTFFHPELVQTALEMSLRKLQLSYVDLFLIHFPTALKPGKEIFPKDSHGKTIFDTVDLCSTWEGSTASVLEKCKGAGLAKSIGVSNFNHRQLEMILNKSGLKYKRVCNQALVWGRPSTDGGFCREKQGPREEALRGRSCPEPSRATCTGTGNSWGLGLPFQCEGEHFTVKSAGETGGGLIAKAESWLWRFFVLVS
ncbi:aldo-keto reductase family 1 member C23-like protein [Artibeus jamaicensis]|uniref:aldo-keto reductase family 1 member C23-like protein n=1 Tax=Artibeus jamaicensis TaxID=9417 RepID=UPI00235AEB82|nr:aldo-keto reductase family 1 member C23-like protein [Artibeus jamaicensis]